MMTTALNVERPTAAPNLAHDVVIQAWEHEDAEVIAAPVVAGVGARR